MSKTNKKLIVECFGKIADKRAEFDKAIKAAVEAGYYTIDEVRKNNISEHFYIQFVKDENGQDTIAQSKALLGTVHRMQKIDGTPMFNDYQIGKKTLTPEDRSAINRMSPMKQERALRRLTPLTYVEKMDVLRRALHSSSVGYNAFFLLTKEGQDERKYVQMSDFCLVATKMNGKYKILEKNEYMQYIEGYIANKKVEDENRKMDFYGTQYMRKIDPNEQSIEADSLAIYDKLNSYMDMPYLKIRDNAPDNISQFDSYISGYQGFYTYAGSDNSHYVPAGKKSHLTMYKNDRLSKVTKEEFNNIMEYINAVEVFKRTLTGDDVNLFDDLDIVECPVCGEKIRQSAEYCPHCWTEIYNPFHDMDPDWIDYEGNEDDYDGDDYIDDYDVDDYAEEE